MTIPTTVRADEVRKGDYLTNGQPVEMRRNWTRVAAVRTLKGGRVSIRRATGAWGSAMVGTHQSISYLAADETVEVAR